MIVVDANVIVYYLLPSPYTKQCTALYQNEPEWIAPRLWRDELLNVLATYERNQLLSREDALSIFVDAARLIDANEYDIVAERVLAVASRTGCSGYDAQYVSLAEDLSLKLYTFDKKILRKLPELAVQP